LAAQEPAASSAQLHIRASSISFLAIPSNGTFGGTVVCSWALTAPVAENVTETSIRFGSVSVPNGPNLTTSAYPFALRPLGSVLAPGRFEAIVPLNFSRIFLRAHAVMGGREWWSPEHAINVLGAGAGPPFVDLTIPRGAEVGDGALVNWSVGAPLGGVLDFRISPTVGGERRDVGEEQVSLGSSRATGQVPLEIPYAGNWTVNATLVTGDAAAAWNETTFVVANPVHPAVALFPLPRFVAPNERVAFAWHVVANGPVEESTARIGASGLTIDGSNDGSGNYSVVLNAPTAGNLSLQAFATIEGTEYDSNLSTITIASGASGTYNVTLLFYPSEATRGSKIPVAFRVQGPDGEAGPVVVHEGNASVPGPAASVAPADYNGPVVPADLPPGGFVLPGTFRANLTAPAAAGYLYFRARVVVNGLPYWSDEGAIRIL
jgi:hypothetical protein